MMKNLLILVALVFVFYACSSKPKNNLEQSRALGYEYGFDTWGGSKELEKTLENIKK